MAEYLLEVRTEEIPARMLEPGLRRLGTRVFEELMGKGLGPGEVETGFTPRRLVLVLRGLPEGEPDRVEEVVGPPAKAAFDADGEPTKALLGFARKLGVDPGELERIETDKGEYVAARQEVRGRPIAEVLAGIVPEVLVGIPWAKTMRWGEGRGPWVRPVHGLVSLLDGAVVPLDLFGVAAGDRTVGHPILSPEEVPVADAGTYRQALAARGIEIDPRERSARLAAEMARRAEAAGGTVVEDPELLSRLAAMCEIPGVMEGSFDEAFLELPREVLVTSLKDHQSAFTVEKDGALLARFLTVMDRPDDPEGRVRAGNEWVVEARLADAKFFYAEDRRRPLAERAEELRHLAFHARLGSYEEKAERLAALAGWLAEALRWERDRPAAERAARLLKLDLVTEMVKELTSLQGVMGGIYAREDGAPEAVWQAVYDQYLPAGTDDDLPRGRVGVVTALADRFDTLAGLFGLGQVPSGSRDPFGLRRAAQGAVRIALEFEQEGLPSGLHIDLLELARKAVEGYGDALERSTDEIERDLRLFLEDRVRYILGLRGYAYDEIEAGLGAGEGMQWLPELESRVKALHAARDEPGFLAVVLAAKRIANILQGEPIREATGGVRPDEGAFEQQPERALFHEAEQLLEKVGNAYGEGQHLYESALRDTARLAEVLERFFDEVLVMTEDRALRENRLKLLRFTESAISGIADLTRMVVDREEHRKRHGEAT